MKNWNKPNVIVMPARDLANYIKVAARSVVCYGDFYR